MLAGGIDVEDDILIFVQFQHIRMHTTGATRQDLFI